MTFKHCSVVAIALAIVFGSSSSTIAAERIPLRQGAVDVYFAPQDDIALYVIDFISKAQRRVWLAGFTFTMPEIAQAVAQAKARGLDVRVVLDSSQANEKYSVVTYLRNADVPVWIDSRHAIMHQKFVVCDDDRVGFGSANFTKAAMAGRKSDPVRWNAENFNLFVGVPALAKQYANEFEHLVAESKR